MKAMKNKWAISVAAATFLVSGSVFATDHDVDALKAEVQELKDWKASVQSQPILEPTKDNMVFFRGGWAHNTGGGTAASRRGDILVDLGEVGIALGNPTNSSRDAWYFGAGFDFSLEDNLWGLMDNTEVLAELMFDYKEFSEEALPIGVLQTVAASTVANALTPVPGHVTVTQFQLSASPKIKFMKGSDFRPWIIPIGFVLNVISPPSDGVTVLTPGMMFAGGMDYRIWKNLYIGADVRYQLASRTGIDGVDVSGIEAGGYLGIGF